MRAIAEDLLNRAIRCLQDHQAQDPVVIEVGPKTVIADHFLIATARSGTHLSALAEALGAALKDDLHHQEGDRHSSWVLLDCRDLIIHLFLPEARAFYALERLWGDVASWPAGAGAEAGGAAP